MNEGAASILKEVVLRYLLQTFITNAAPGAGAATQTAEQAWRRLMWPVFLHDASAQSQPVSR